MSPQRTSPSWPRTGAVVAAVFLWLAATAGIRSLMAPDEGRYVGVAFEMLRTGDWLVPRLDGLPFFHKPPLFYWLSAAAMSVLGTSEWAARLPSILGATVAAAGLYLFLRRRAGEASAKLAAVVLITMPFFYVGAQFANLDMLVAGCISATVLFAAHAALSKEEGHAWRAALAGAFFFGALGVLAKGLIGIVLPGMVFVAWCIAIRRLRAVWLMAWPPGLLILVAVAGPWFLAMQARYPEFFDYFVVTQHFRRFAQTGFNNQHPFWFYLPVIVGLTLPWFPWLAAARRRAGKPAFTLSAVDWLMVIWCLAVVVFFSLPRSKLIGYVLPALPPLAYLIARAALGVAANTSRPVRWTVAVAGFVCVAGVVLLAVKGTQPGTRIRLPAGEHVAPADQVLMLDAYYYELPLHWKLEKPVMVSGEWTASVVNQRDDWRKELYDAGRFEPDRASSLLIHSSRIHQVLCVPSTTWVVGPIYAPMFQPWLARARQVAPNPQAAVWRFDGSPGRDEHCLDTPSAGPPRAVSPP